MRIVRGMHRSFQLGDEEEEIGWSNKPKSFITSPNARTRDKSKSISKARRGSGSSSSSNNNNNNNNANTNRQSAQIAGDDVQEQQQQQILCEDLPVEIDKVDTVDDDLDVTVTTASEKTEIETVETTTTTTTSLRVIEEEETDGFKTDGISYQSPDIGGSSYPPPPPAPPPRPSSTGSNSRRFGNSSRRATAWPVVSTRTPPVETRCENDGYNSADEQNPCYGSSYGDAERERQFEIDIRRTKGYEVKRMLEDGNCLFRAVADQIYGDSEAYDLARQMCIDYMERERDHFSQFITEGFTSYCKRKRRDKVYGNNVEIQALSEMYNRPIHIYSYSTEPINIFHGSYNTDTPPIRLSYHHGNHYNSLVDPRRLTIGAGLGFSSLQGPNVDKDQVKAAIKAQQDQQIDNALLAEARFCSDVELTEKEIERMVMEASRAEYMANDKFKQQLGRRESSTSNAEPSSSGGGPSGSESRGTDGSVLCNSMQMVLSMGFSYVQAMEAYSIFGDDVDSMVCYLLETSSRRKGKATE